MARKNRFLAVFLFCSVFMLGFCFNNNFCVQAKDFALTIFHTNDSHGRVAHEACLKSLINEKKNKGENILVMSAGDIFHGQLIAQLSRGKSIVEIMNKVGYDYIAPGNHDFNYNLDGLKEIEKNGDFKILAGNIINKEKESIFKEYDIKEIDGVKVGIFGLATPETMLKSSGRKSLEEFEFAKPVDIAKKIVKKLKDNGCDIIILISHLGLDKSSLEENRSDYLAQNVDGIDLIIDGHSHTELKNGLKIKNSLIAQTGEHGKNIGVVELKLNLDEKDKKNNKIVEKKAYLISGKDMESIKPDEKIVKIIENENEKIKDLVSQGISKIAFDLDGERENSRTRETNFFDLLTDSILEKTKSDIIVLNGGIIRESIRAGEITIGDIYNALPFENIIVSQDMPGEEILKVLEHGVSKYPDSFGGNIQVAGVKFKFDKNKKAGERVYDVVLNNGEKLEINKKYNLATSQFSFEGGDGYNMFVKNNSYKEHESPQEMLISFIKSHHDLKKYKTTQDRIKIQAQTQKQEINKKIAREYKIKKGDTLWKIALKFNISLKKIIDLNQIKNPDLIYPDRILKLS